MSAVILVWALWISTPEVGPTVRAYFHTQESCQATANALNKKYGPALLPGKAPDRAICLPGDYIHAYPQPTERKLS